MKNRVLLRKKEELKTKKQNKIKPDVILKTFWRNNERFADLFNAVVFNGRQILKPEDLTEVDTDLSSLLKMNGHVETIQRIFDVSKKTSDGVHFVIWGLENQDKVHYGMPLRHMLNDALTYLKECKELTARNRKEKNLKSSREFLSGIKKSDRLHPVISICLYYGEELWDGPLCLRDMLEIPDEVKEIVPDYKLNLVQVRNSENLLFHNQEVRSVFEITRSIYNREYDKINADYAGIELDTETALVIGSITKSQRIIDQALDVEQKGGSKMEMCKGLQALEQRGVEAGIRVGIQNGKKQLLKQQIEKKLAKGKSIEVIADELEEEISSIQSLMKEMENEKEVV